MQHSFVICNSSKTRAQRLKLDLDSLHGLYSTNAETKCKGLKGDKVLVKKQK